jgi:hypothetical protein
MPLKDGANAAITIEFRDVPGLHGNVEPNVVIHLELAKTPTNAVIDLTTHLIEVARLQFGG